MLLIVLNYVLGTVPSTRNATVSFMDTFEAIPTTPQPITLTTPNTTTLTSPSMFAHCIGMSEGLKLCCRTFSLDLRSAGPRNGRESNVYHRFDRRPYFFLRYLLNPTLIFTWVKQCIMWPWLSTTLDFESLSFQNDLISKLKLEYTLLQFGANRSTVPVPLRTPISPGISPGTAALLFLQVFTLAQSWRFFSAASGFSGLIVMHGEIHLTELVLEAVNRADLNQSTDGCGILF